MRYFLIALLTIVLVLLSGCSKPQSVNIPKPFEKPQSEKYEFQIFKINDQQFYVLQESEALKLSKNWITYKSWCEANYELLSKIKESK